jgi:hypothetical protein
MGEAAMGWRMGATVLALLGAMGQATQPALVLTNSVDDELKRLGDLQVAVVGREAVVKGYEAVLEKIGNDPRAAGVMLRLASVYGTVAIPDKGITPDPVAAEKWLRRAAETADVGSETWKEAQFEWAATLKWERGSGGPEQARAVLQKVAEQFPDDALLQMRVEQEVAFTYIGEDIHEVERHARQVTERWSRLKATAKDAVTNREADSLAVNVVGVTLEAWKTVSATAAEQAAARARWERDFPTLVQIAAPRSLPGVNGGHDRGQAPQGGGEQQSSQ